MSTFKKIKHLSEVKGIIKNNPNRVSDSIIDVFQNFMASKKVQEFGKVKKKGVSTVSILTWASQNQKEWKNDFLKIVANISKNYIFEKIIKGRIKRDGINNNKVSE